MKTRVVVGVVVFGILGTVSGIGAIVYVLRGELPTAAVLVGGAAFCLGLVVPQPKVARGHVVPRIAFDSGGTIFRPDRGIDVPAQVSLSGLVMASMLIAILLPIGRLGLPVPSNIRIALPLMTAFIAVTASPLVWRNLRRGSTRYLRLTTNGFEFSQGWQRNVGGAWASVKGVAADEPGQSAPTQGAIVFVMSDDTALSLAAGSITAGSSSLRELVRFYWQHPECREELTDGRAAARLVRGAPA